MEVGGLQIAVEVVFGVMVLLLGAFNFVLWRCAPICTFLNSGIKFENK